jgi:hypothetical protein
VWGLKGFRFLDSGTDGGGVKKIQNKKAFLQVWVGEKRKEKERGERREGGREKGR